MMRKFIMCFIIISILGNIELSAEVVTPEKVKIGLYYGSSAMPVVSVKGQIGLSAGFDENGEFKELYEYLSQDGMSIRKDSYFVKNGSLIIEFKPSDKNIPQGEKMGPYHIQIGNGYSDKAALQKELNNIIGKNIKAYPVYNNGKWFIWYGLYLDSASAGKGIEDCLKPAIGGTAYEIIEPSARRVQVIAGDDIKLIFEAENQFLRIRPKASQSPNLININGKNFRGEVEIRRYDTSDMTVINILPLEEYLYGVVPKEIGASSPIEAIKAQAVAARNYAIGSIGKNSKWGFDMTNTDKDQVYGGCEWEKESSNKGVDQTAGKKLMYNGKLASVFYFSTSGGRTEDVKNVWGSQGYPYLVSVEDKYEPSDLKYSNWEVTLTASQIRDSLKAQGYDLGDITTVQPLEFSKAGRVVKLLIKGTKGEKTFEREKCRTVFGKSILSQWYTVSAGDNAVVLREDGNTGSISIASAVVKSADGVFDTSKNGSRVFAKGADGIKEYSGVSSGFKFRGKGWGHGIGMSQNGAIGMAKAGFTYDQILQWYFKGTYVE